MAGKLATVVAVAALALIPIPSAHADGSAYSTIARAFWGGDPPCGDPVIYDANYSADHAGHADGYWCSIGVNWRYTGSLRCMIVTHEWGHLLGYPDDYAFWSWWDPNGVMYYALDLNGGAIGVRWPCAW